MKYEQVTDGEWWVIEYGESKRRMRQVCCECCLVHDWQFRVNPDGTISAKVTVNRKATNAARRRYGIENIVKVLTDWWSARNDKAVG
jgi:hypothetical protein